MSGQKSGLKQHRISIDLDRLSYTNPISYKVIGLPGTGKTTFLINSLTEMLNHSISIKHIVYCSHTKTAVQEVQERLTRKFPNEKGISQSVRTIHSLCHGLVRSVTSVKSLTSKQKTAFMRQFILSTNFEVWEEFQENFEDKDISWDYRRYRESDLFQLSSTLQLSVPDNDPMKLKDRIIDFWIKLVDRDIEQELVQLSFIFHFQYLNYKQSNNFFEFEDLLSYTLQHQLYPNKKVLIMDEFQDCSPLQFELYRLWSSKVQLSIIAGDPNQAIYGFQNSTPHFLLTHEVSELEILLNRSYRLPPKIVELAQQQMSSSRYLSEYKSDISITHVGSIEKIGLTDLVLNAEPTFILVRTNSQMKTISNKLTEQGILHITNTTTIPKEVIQQLKLWYPLISRFNTGIFTSHDIHNVIQVCGISPPAENIIVVRRTHIFSHEIMPELHSRMDSLSRTEFLKLLDLGWDSFLSLLMEHVDKRIRPLIIQGLERNADLTSLTSSINNTQLMTIHKSKGKEADTVVIIDKATYYESQGREDSEEERRVWYVAITRAKKRLIIINMGNDRTRYLDMEEDDGDDGE